MEVIVKNDTKKFSYVDYLWDEKEAEKTTELLALFNKGWKGSLAK